MKILGMAILLLASFGGNSQAQTSGEPSKNEAEIKAVLSTFMGCLVKKDSAKFYSLFHDGPVAWVGVFKEKSQQQRLQKNNAIKNDYFNSNYKSFYRSISNEGFDEEKFYNIVICDDGYVASVTFDYSFWSGGKKENWGKESWALVKENGLWKITSVIFSLEFENVAPEPVK